MQVTGIGNLSCFTIHFSYYLVSLHSFLNPKKILIFLLLVVGIMELCQIMSPKISSYFLFTATWQYWLGTIKSNKPLAKAFQQVSIFN